MYDDLRALVRAEFNRQIKAIRPAHQYSIEAQKEGEALVETARETMQDLLDFIDGLENPEP